MSFANNLSREMERKAWKPVHLAAALSDQGLDCHPLTIQRYMSGEREPKASMVRAIAAALGVDVAELFLEVSIASATPAA